MKRLLFLFIIFAFAATACKKLTMSDKLSGSWQRTDRPVVVLVFGTPLDGEYLTLHSGTRVDNAGNTRPLEFWYQYYFNESCDTIHCNALTSSIWAWPGYYFSYQDTIIRMGDIFHDSDSVFTYRRLH